MKDGKGDFEKWRIGQLRGGFPHWDSADSFMAWPDLTNDG
jgi:hypothetical protein